MNSVKKIIADNSKHYEHFDYYLIIIEKAEQNAISNPDISIECCKSLIEGISKSILKTLDKAYNPKYIDKMDLSPLVKKALEKLSEFDPSIEDSFITRSTSLIHVLGEVRNKRGDISHGKHTPKDYSSNAHFSSLVLHISEGIIFYILKIFFSIDLTFQEMIVYDDNSGFNDWLDEQHPLDSNVSYSRALYDQYYVDYELQLEEYNIAKEERDNE